MELNVQTNGADRKAARIGIMGGTFDPIHIGHLIIAEQAWFELKLDKVIFIPAGIPPHKPDQPSTPAAYRYRMVELAIEDNPVFGISDIEITRPGPSFTVDTLAEFKQIYGENVELFLITGADTIAEIMTWHQPEKLIELCRLVSVTRPGYDLSEIQRSLPKRVLNRSIFIEGPGVQISATELRHRVKSGKPIVYLTPRAVERYIIKKGLYRAVEECKG